MKTRLLIVGVIVASLMGCHHRAQGDEAAAGGLLPSPSEGETQAAAGVREKDNFLGLKVADFDSTGFFRLAQLGDRWFLVTPQGHPFYRLGLNGVTPWYGIYRKGAFTSKYGESVAAWGKEAVRRIKSWSFNVLEYRTTPDLIRLMKKGEVERMPFSIVIPFVENIARKRTDFPDVFSQKFAEHADAIAKEYTQKLSDDPYLIGYYLGNELDFDLTGKRKWRSRWVKSTLKQNADSPGYRAFIDMIKQKYANAESFNKAHGTSIKSLDALDHQTMETLMKEDRQSLRSDIAAFNSLLAKKFYEVASKAVRQYDPHHLILGTRFGGGAEPGVLESTAPFTDIVSINLYTLKRETLLSTFEDIHRRTGKPIHHSEFSFCIKGRNGGSGGGTYPPVPSQRARGTYYREFAEAEFSLPYVIGFSWYEYVDPKEDTNFGLIDKNDRVYDEAVSQIAEANRKIEEAFAGAIRELVSRAGKPEK
jgi:hypothetical protein